MPRRWIIGLLTAGSLLAAGTNALACGPEIDVRFIDADGDVFVIDNKSQEPWHLASLEIRLAGSLGRLVFDTEDGGLGESMYQPFEPVDGEVALLVRPVVADGAEHVTLRFRDFRPGRTFMFVIDVDDRLENSDYGRAVVSGAEIEGAVAVATLTMANGARTRALGRFGDDGRARLRGGPCA